MSTHTHKPLYDGTARIDTIGGPVTLARRA